MWLCVVCGWAKHSMDPSTMRFCARAIGTVKMSFYDFVPNALHSTFSAWIHCTMNIVHRCFGTCFVSFRFFFVFFSDVTLCSWFERISWRKIKYRNGNGKIDVDNFHVWRFCSITIHVIARWIRKKTRQTKNSLCVPDRFRCVYVCMWLVKHWDIPIDL